MTILEIIAGPAIGAVIGYCTNYIAVKMLFRPLKPIKIGIEEQEQNGVTVPSRAAMMFALIPCKPPRIRLVLSGGK